MVVQWGDPVSNWVVPGDKSPLILQIAPSQINVGLITEWDSSSRWINWVIYVASKISKPFTYWPECFPNLNLDWSSFISRLLQLSNTYLIDLLGYWYLYWYLAWVLSIGIGYWYWVLGMATIYTSLTSLLASLLLDRLLGVDPPAHRLLIGVLHSKYTVKGWKEYIVKRGDKSILSRVEKSILQRGEKNILSRSEKSILRRGEKRILSRGELNCNCLEVTWRPSSWSQQCQGVRNTQTQMHK